MKRPNSIPVLLAAALALALAGRSAASGPGRPAAGATVSSVAVATFAGDAQHTGVYDTPALDLNAILWSVPIDLNNTGAEAHYGAPVITSASTVIVPVKTASDGFEVRAFDGTGGSAKYTLTTDYILPSHNWIPSYQPALAEGATAPRLYYAGAGGTVYYLDDPDADIPGSPGHLVFYT